MVSLIVPCYNGEKFIARCIESILNQTDHNIELILVNDGSMDSTSDIINGYRVELENTLAKFIYLEQENQGVGAACNNAFKRATGKYLTLLDSDDILLPESVSEMRKWLDEHPEHGFVRTNGYYVTEETLDSCERYLEVNDYMKTKENIFDEIFEGITYVWPGTYMIRMDVLKSLYPDREIYPSRYGQNLQFLMMAAYVSRAGFIDCPLMKYTLRRESLSHFSSGDVLKKELKAMEGYKDIRVHLVEHFIDIDKQKEWNNRIEKLYANVFLNLAVKYADKNFAKECYAKIKKMSGRTTVDLNLRITYYKLMSPLRYYGLRVLRKVGIVR